MEDNISEMISRQFEKERSPVCEKFPVIQRPWGGKDATRLMLEIYPGAFENGLVCAAIEMGYLDTGDYEPEEWVKANCSGLAYVGHHDLPEQRKRCFVMRIDENAVKPDSPYKYLISGYSGGEFSVAIWAMFKDKVQPLFEQSYCCK